MGRHGWRADTEAKCSLLRGGLPVLEHRFHTDEIAQLPPPVRRYFLTVFHDGQLLPPFQTLEQRGEILLSERWRPFRATSHVRLRPPGFVWDARVRLFAGVTAWVRDAYVGGRGSMDASVAGVIPLIASPPSREISEAALQRYLAEGPWAPATLLPSAGVEWSPLGEHLARASLTDASTSVSVSFGFGPGGTVSEVQADRYRSLEGRQVRTRWIGRFGDYQLQGGFLVPEHGVVGWAPDGEWQPYWRGRILTVSHEVP